MLPEKKYAHRLQELFTHIKYRQHQGALVFLSCKTSRMSEFLIQWIQAEFESQYSLARIPFHAASYSPLTFISALSGAHAQRIYIIDDFPFESFYASSKAYDNILEDIAVSLNLYRDVIPDEKLKCVLICPPEVEDRIALEASDFYHFTNYSAFFEDGEACFQKADIPDESGDHKNDRIRFLEKSLKNARTEFTRATILQEIGLVYNNLSQYEQSLSFLDDALKIYRSLGDQKAEAEVMGDIGLIRRALGQGEQVEECHDA